MAKLLTFGFPAQQKLLVAIPSGGLPFMSRELKKAMVRSDILSHWGLFCRRIDLTKSHVLTEPHIPWQGLR